MFTFIEMKETKDILIKIQEEGRTKNWVMQQLSMSRRTFYKRVNENSWRDEELKKLRLLGIL
tara:strand:+ start:115 stop:300 length:186 start_codon:yes stop_codon:yes gene_type:complete